jgi:hypothetical protein
MRRGETMKYAMKIEDKNGVVELMHITDADSPEEARQKIIGLCGIFDSTILQSYKNAVIEPFASMDLNGMVIDGDKKALEALTKGASNKIQ